MPDESAPPHFPGIQHPATIGTPPEGATVHYSRAMVNPSCGQEWIPGVVWCAYQVALVTCRPCLEAEVKRATDAIEQCIQIETTRIHTATARLVHFAEATT